jgi:hypothetical protein
MLLVYNLSTFDISYYFDYEDLTFVIVLTFTFVQSSLVLKGIMFRWTKGINI